MEACGEHKEGEREKGGFHTFPLPIVPCVFTLPAVSMEERGNHWKLLSKQ